MRREPRRENTKMQKYRNVKLKNTEIVLKWNNWEIKKSKNTNNTKIRKCKVVIHIKKISCWKAKNTILTYII